MSVPLLRRLIVAPIAVSSLVAALAIPTIAVAEPITQWATRSTKLDTVGKCTRRAFTAMKNADLDAKASGTLAVYGRSGGAAIYVVCTDNGAVAAVFCAHDNVQGGGKNLGNLCNTVTRLMEP